MLVHQNVVLSAERTNKTNITNYKYIATHVLNVFFQGYPEQKGVGPRSRKYQNRPFTACLFCKSLPPIENVHSVAQNLPVGVI